MSEKMLIGNGGGLKKRNEKADNKEQEKQDKINRSEAESVRSGESRLSKYSVGSHLPSGAIVKEVKEVDWTFVKKEKGRDWFACKHCHKISRKDNRNTHVCNV